MDFLRSNILRRGGTSNEQDDDIEQQRLPEMREDEGRIRARSRGFSLGLGGPAGRFSRRLVLQRRNTHGTETDSPKTPRFNLARPTMSSTRPHLPNISQAWTQESSGASTSTQTSPPRSNHVESGRTSQPHTSTEQVPVIVGPPPTAHQRHGSRGSINSGRRFRGADPAEMHLADLAETGRRRRARGHSDGSRRSGRRDGTEKPKRFLFCFPWIKSRRTRTQVLRCFVSGIFLTLLLTVYLALSITKNINNSEFTVLLILVILFTTIVFCHGLIRLCMLVVKPPSLEDDRSRSSLPQMLGPGGYAIPRRPIRVVLARDEEAAGMESETTKLQPPAYGLWRESVRVDPNRIYWQRNDQATPENGEWDSADDGRPATSNRPPSYASEDGVEYVVEARPRSVVPLGDVPLPPHPSERVTAGGHLAAR